MISRREFFRGVAAVTAGVAALSPFKLFAKAKPPPTVRMEDGYFVVSMPFEGPCTVYQDGKKLDVTMTHDGMMQFYLERDGQGVVASPKIAERYD